MDQLATLEYALEELRRTVASLDDSHMETVTNCEPWTVRRLLRFAAGSLAGAAFVPVGLALHLRARRLDRD